MASLTWPWIIWIAHSSLFRGKMEAGREGGRLVSRGREEVINSEGSCLRRTNGRGICEETLDLLI